MLGQYAPAPYRTISRNRESVSLLGLTAVVTALHVAVLARRVPVRGWQPGQAAPFIWQESAEAPAIAQAITERTPSNPTHIFAVGQLALEAGMAIVTLAVWLHIMRINGVRGL